MKFLQSTNTPLEDLELLAVPDQDPKRRGYRTGYEKFFDIMPVIGDQDNAPSLKARLARTTMDLLAEHIIADNWLTEKDQGEGDFARTIIGMEKPMLMSDTHGTTNLTWTEEGAEFLVAHWGIGFTSPVHGHSPGYLHEAVLKGKIRVNTYQMIDSMSQTVRLAATTIADQGTFISQFAPGRRYHWKRSVLIHNFVALEPSHSLHYVPEHTRDGRDNQFYPEYFEDIYDLSPQDLHQLDPKEAMYSKPGTVILVRSAGVPEYGDHYIVITGPPVLKPNGLRPQDVVFDAPHTSHIFAGFQPQEGVTLLQLDRYATEAFFDFHNIQVSEDAKLVMPAPASLELAY